MRVAKHEAMRTVGTKVSLLVHSIPLPLPPSMRRSPAIWLPLALPLPSVLPLWSGVRQVCSTMAVAASARKTTGLISGPAMTALQLLPLAKKRAPTMMVSVCWPMPRGTALGKSLPKIISAKTQAKTNISRPQISPLRIPAIKPDSLWPPPWPPPSWLPWLSACASAAFFLRGLRLEINDFFFCPSSTVTVMEASSTGAWGLACASGLLSCLGTGAVVGAGSWTSRPSACALILSAMRLTCAVALSAIGKVC
mmetsp:Transcript_2660/g.5560  ORF Transcript_2660/g.5560 Transcript_2660/m.5560 type:complete len:252 (+) Transcript_2660:4811-5566(+)